MVYWIRSWTVEADIKGSKPIDPQKCFCFNYDDTDNKLKYLSYLEYYVIITALWSSG